jgi:hypothetical protein
MSLSSTNTEPLSGASMAPRTEIRLVLPLPEGPEMTVKSPGLSMRSMPLSAVIRAAPDPKPKVTARNSTLCTKHSPGVYAHRRSRRNQRSQNAKHYKRASHDEVHPMWNRHPPHHEAQHCSEGLDDE